MTTKTATTPKLTVHDAVEATALQEATDAVQELQRQLGASFYERDVEIRCLLVALIACEHVLLEGPPGTGKSALADALCGALGGRKFGLLMTKFTVTEEVFGPISLQGLKQDKYRRVTTGMFQEAEVAFLDEIFKSNSAILNSLLKAINERVYEEGGQRHPIPLEMVIAASNELPQDSSLGALYDRFLLRRSVAKIKSRAKKRALLLKGGTPPVTAKLSAEQLANLRTAREMVDLEPVADMMLDIFDRVEAEHGIEPSDRRMVKAGKIVQAHAVLCGRTAAAPSDLRILADLLWNEPSERPAIESVVADVAGPDAGMLAAQLVEAAVEAASEVKLDAQGREFTMAAGTANERLRGILAELDDLGEGPEVDAARERITEIANPIRRELAKRLGL